MTSTMDDVIEFFRAFAAAEHEAVLAYHLEPSVAALREKLRAATARMHITPDNIMSIQPSGRLHDLTEAQVAEAKKTIGTYRYVPRTLFLVEQFAHKTLGDLFVGYVSDKQRLDEGAAPYLAERHVARRFDGSLAIFAMQSVDPFAKDARTKLTWKHHQGTRVTGLTKPIAVAKVEPPGDALGLAYWNSR